MQFQFHSRLQATLLSAGLILGLTTLMPAVEARIASNGISLQGTSPKNELALSSGGWTKNGTALNRMALNGSNPNPGVSVVSLRDMPTNGILLNGATLKFDSGSTAQLQLEGSQLVLQFNRPPGGPNCLERPCPPPTVDGNFVVQDNVQTGIVRPVCFELPCPDPT
jgi:hypothetical protein